MDLSAENQKRGKFREILLDLAQSQEVLREKSNRVQFYQRLEELYYSPDEVEKYRHFYSDIFPLLTQIYRGDSVGSIDILSENLRILREGYRAINRDKDGNTINIEDNLRKLYDHVNLEVARINYTGEYVRQEVHTEQVDELQHKVKTFIQHTEEQQSKFDSKVSGFDEKIKETQNQLEETQNQLNKSERDYIAILGIFSSVVLTFTAGIAFSTSVLNNIGQVSIYRLLATALVIGLVLLNILFVMFHFTGKLIKNDAPLKPFLVSNGIFIVLLITIVIAWCSGCVENRNLRITRLGLENVTSSSVATSSNTSSFEVEVDQISEQQAAKE